jgi:hypothetical protein
MFFLFTLFLAMMMPAKAQFFNDVDIGGGVRYSRQSDKANVGIDVIATKSVTDWATLRAVASVNGFIPNGFDRAGMAMCGVMAEARAAYVFADFGLSWNPSAKPPVIGMAFDGGVGIKVNVAPHLRLFSELGIDRIGHGRKWKSTASVKAGLLYCN